MSPTLASRPDEREALLAEQVRRHVSMIPLAVLGSTAVALLLGSVLWDAFPDPVVLAWFGLIVPPHLLRLVLGRRHRQRPDSAPLTVWRRRFRTVTLSHGAAWGAVSVLLFPAGQLEHQTFLAFCLSGMAASSVTITSFDLVGSLGFLGFVMAPLAVTMMIESSQFSATMGLVMMLFASYMTLTARRAHRDFALSVLLRRAAAARAEALARFQGALAVLRGWRGGGADFFATAVRETVAALDLSRAVLWLDRDGDSALHKEAEAGAAAGRAPAPATVALTALPRYAALAAQGTALVHGAPGSAAAFAEIDAAALRDLRAAGRIDVPITVAGRLEGLLWCEREDLAGWSGDEEAFVAAVGAKVLNTRHEARRRAAEQQLREVNGRLEELVAARTLDLTHSEERFRAVFAKSPMIVALVRTADNRIAELNEAGLRAFGYTRAEVIGRTSQELELWGPAGQRPPGFGQLLRDGVFSDLEVQLRRKDGQCFWALLNSTQVTLDGEPYSLATALDITERRELEARFIQSQKMEVVGHLAGGIAHDFNNLLTVITGTAELAMSDPAAMPEALVTIRDASARAATLTGQLMAFSRRQILQPVGLDLNEVVTGLSTMLRRAGGALIRLEIVPASEPATLVADRGALEQAILNLTLNARDAMPDGGTLRLAVSHAEVSTPHGHGGVPPGRYVVLTITDTGTGMSEEVQRRIFEPFFTTKAVGKGTGLGLSMAHGFVSQSGGDITVRSTVGTGTTFVIRLPWTAQAAPAAIGAAAAPQAGHETILVVDDNREIREVVRRVLTFSGYRVLSAEHGEDALRQLREHDGTVALLLTDVVMPGLTGRELAIRVREGYPGIRVLFTSGYAGDAIARQGVLAQGVEFIAKPYSLQALTRKVRDVLDAPA